MKTTLRGTMTSLLLGALALTIDIGCGDDGGRHYCETWCDMAVSVEFDRLEQEGCEFTDDEDVFDADCVEECKDISFDTESPSAVKDCISCTNASAGGSPTWDQLQNALNGPCEEECFAESMTDFWFDFWDAWGYEDYDFDCD